MKLTDDNARDGAAEGAHENMAQAWAWLCEQRTLSPEGADVWDIRWQTLNAGEGWLTDLTHRVLRGAYRLSPLQLIGLQESRKAVWGAQDALVLKWVALSLQDQLPLHASCEHVKGHGGGKASIAGLHALLTATSDTEKKTGAEGADRLANRGYTWVCRTDIRGYYRNINKQTLLSQVRQHVQSPVLLDLVAQYLHYTVEDGGTFHTPERGISRGCPLSPLMGALHLYDMDEHFSAQRHIHYARYMDDIIILAKSRWHLRRHTKRLMQWFSAYDFEAHPDKTQIGRTRKGFDWMGAWLTDAGVTDIAPRAKANHREKVRRLYERLARVPLWARKREKQRISARVSTYRKRWNIWAGTLLALASGAAFSDGPLVISAIPAGVVYPLDTGSVYNTVTRTPAAGQCTAAAGCSGGDFPNDLAYGTIGNQGASTSNVCVRSGDYTGGGTTWTILANGMGGFVTTNGLALIPVATVRNVGSNPASATIDATNPSIKGFGYITNMISTVPYTGQGAYLCPVVSAKRVDSVSDYSEATIALHVWLAKAPTPGATNITHLTLSRRIYARPSANAAINVPTSLVVSGLACTLSLSGNASNTIDLGVVSPQFTANQLAASATFTLDTTCTGTNAPDAGATYRMGLTIAPSGSSNIPDPATPDRISSPSDNGHYLTIRTGTAASCSGGLSAAPGATPLPVHSFQPSEVGGTWGTTLTASLCYTGRTSQTLGDHTITLLASSVAY